MRRVLELALHARDTEVTLPVDAVLALADVGAGRDPPLREATQRQRALVYRIPYLPGGVPSLEALRTAQCCMIHCLFGVQQTS